MDLKAGARIREILTRSRVDDWDTLRATMCYQADECCLDGTCPFLAGCERAETSGGD